jgi:hypothetical protein
MTAADRVKLLFGPYQAPRIQRGDRAHCAYRDTLVVVTGWTDAPIPWPRCRALDSPGGGSGLLVDEELARAVRSESAAAVMHWWRASPRAVWAWQKALGVGRADSEGSRRLIRAAAEKGAARLRGKQLPPAQVERRRRTAIEKGLGRNLVTGYHGPRWTKPQIRLLGGPTSAPARPTRSASTSRRWPRPPPRSCARRGGGWPGCAAPAAADRATEQKAATDQGGAAADDQRPATETPAAVKPVKFREFL